LHNGPVSF